MTNKALLLCLIMFHNLIITIKCVHKISWVVESNAYSNDINKCLFNHWENDGVLSKLPTACNDKTTQWPLCYALGGEDPALFISCYNNETKIPDFTAHQVMAYRGKGGPLDKDYDHGVWYNDKGKYAPKPASSVLDPDNYDKKKQADLYPNYKPDKNQYLAKGQCVPNGDITTDYDIPRHSNKVERRTTFINTNAAPQWQPFNKGNWRAMERAITAYVDKTHKEAYVFTGTDGEAVIAGDKRTKFKLHGISVPKYFWKAVCVPGVGTYVFWAENNVGEPMNSGKNKKGCHGKSQDTSLGVIKCKNYDKAKISPPTKHFKLPPFNEDKCKTNIIATFLKKYLLKNLK